MVLGSILALLILIQLVYRLCLSISTKLTHRLLPYCIHRHRYVRPIKYSALAAYDGYFAGNVATYIVVAHSFAELSQRSAAFAASNYVLLVLGSSSSSPLHPFGINLSPTYEAHISLTVMVAIQATADVVDATQN